VALDVFQLVHPDLLSVLERLSIGQQQPPLRGFCALDSSMSIRGHLPPKLGMLNETDFIRAQLVPHRIKRESQRAKKEPEHATLLGRGPGSKRDCCWVSRERV
jgi:hypothetical protein